MSLKPCRECGNLVSSQALTCPICGIKWPRIERLLITALGIIVLAAVIFSLYAGGEDKPIDMASNTTPTKEIFKTTAVQLFLDYEQNEVATDEKIKGKLIEVTGTIQSIDKDFTDSIVISLSTSNQFMAAMMHVDDSQKQVALNLKKGMQVTFDCKKMQRFAGSPSGNDCVFKLPDMNPNGDSPKPSSTIEHQGTINFSPPRPGNFSDQPLTSQALANCLMLAAKTYQVPPSILIGIMQVEDGHIGQETKPDTSGYNTMGPMGLSSRLSPQLAQIWNVDPDTAHKWLRDDGCVNVNVSAWILKRKIIEGGAYSKGIALYHSDTGNPPDFDYEERVIKAMDSKGLIKHDEKLLRGDGAELTQQNGNTAPNQNNHQAEKAPQPSNISTQPATKNVSQYQQRLQRDVVEAIQNFQFCINYHTKNAFSETPYVENGTISLKDWLSEECYPALEAFDEKCEIAYQGSGVAPCDDKTYKALEAKIRIVPPH